MICSLLLPVNAAIGDIQVPLQELVGDLRIPKNPDAVDLVEWTLYPLSAPPKQLPRIPQHDAVETHFCEGVSVIFEIIQHQLLPRTKNAHIHGMTRK